jgi:hypothetical protein
VAIIAALALVTASDLAFAKSSVVAAYVPNIVACNNAGGWFVTVTGDDGVSNTYLFCDGGPQ